MEENSAEEIAENLKGSSGNEENISDKSCISNKK